MKKFLLLSMFAVLLVLSGCLTAQFKSYVFHFDGKTNGTLTITFHNVFAQISEDENTDSVVNADYQEVIDKYIDGDEIEAGYPNARVIKKELFEENGTLSARIVLEFSDPADVKLYRYDKKSPWMYKYSSDETFYDSPDGGDKRFEDIPIVFWDKKHKGDFEFTTSVSDPQGTDQSLLAQWKANPVIWRNNN